MIQYGVCSANVILDDQTTCVSIKTHSHLFLDVITKVDLTTKVAVCNIGPMRIWLSACYNVQNLKRTMLKHP